MLTGHLHSYRSGSKGLTRSPLRGRHGRQEGEGPSSVGTRWWSSAAQVHAPDAVQVQLGPPSPQVTPLQTVWAATLGSNRARARARAARAMVVVGEKRDAVRMALALAWAGVRVREERSAVPVVVVIAAVEWRPAERDGGKVRQSKSVCAWRWLGGDARRAGGGAVRWVCLKCRRLGSHSSCQHRLISLSSSCRFGSRASGPTTGGSHAEPTPFESPRTQSGGETLPPNGSIGSDLDDTAPDVHVCMAVAIQRATRMDGMCLPGSGCLFV